jgi:UDP-GlcNAc:undecaprenyl-phosphate GlcNAc-1-phosphate transferase
MQIALSLGATGVLAFLISAVIIPVIITVSHKRAWYDIPNNRKIHTGPIPRLGGIGIYFGFMAASLAVPLLLPVIFPGFQPAGYTLGYLPVFLAFTLIHGMGLVDDFHNLRALLKFLLQIAAAALVTVGGFTISRFSVPGWRVISLGVFSYPITILWLVAISNAMNLVDGVDGLAGGIAGIAALVIGVICILLDRLIPAFMAFALLGAIIGFLLSNFPPARVFMGDSGSLLIGFVLAALPLMISPGNTSVGELLAPGTVLLVPILDTISAIVRRVAGGRPIQSPDKEHIHHKLLDLGVKEVPLLLIIYGSCAVLGIAAVWSLFLGRWSALALLASLWLVALLAFGALSAMRNRRGAPKANLERPAS